MTLTAPAAGASVSGPVALAATASDNVGITQVDFYVDGTLVGADLTAPFQGSWDSTGSSDGSHTVRAVARDAMGHTATDTVAVTVDNTAPAVSAVSVTAISETAATVTWTTDEPSTSQVEYGTTPAYGSQTPPDATLVTSHSVTVSGLSAATTYNFRVVSSDARSNRATSGNATFTTPDSTAPAVSLTAPADGASVSGTVALAATAGDNVGVTRVDFYVDTTLVGSDATVPYTASWDSALYADGSHTVRAEAYDAAGNSRSTSVNVTLDRSGIVVSGAAVSLTASDTAQITWTTDRPSTSQVQYGPTTAYGSASALDTTLVTSHSVTITGLLPETTYHLRAVSADGGGSSGVSSDLTVGTPALHSTTVTTKVSASTDDCTEFNDASVVLDNWELYAGHPNGTEITDIGMRFGNLAVPPGTMITDARVSVRSHGYGLLGGIRTVFRGLKVPNPATFSPTNRPSQVGKTSAAVPWDLGEWTGDSWYASPNLNSIIQEIVDQPGWAAGNAVGVAWEDNGTPAWLARNIVAYDVYLGPSYAPELSVTYTYVGSDLLPPTVRMTAPVNDSKVSGTVSLAATASDDRSLARVDFYADSTLIGSDSTAPYSAAWDSSGVAEGAHTLRAVAVDASGNSAADTVAVAVDHTVPVVSGVVVTSVTYNTATITWTTDEPSTSRVEYGWTGAYGSLSALDSALVTSHSVTITGLRSETLHHFRVLSADPAGNVGASGDGTFTTVQGPDTYPPTVAFTAPIAGARVNGTVPLAANASDDRSLARVDFYVDVDLVGSDVTAPFTATWNAGIAGVGAHSLRAVAVDASGNTATDTISVIVDRTAPVISNVAVGGISYNTATVTWTTDEPANSRVEYGLTSTYGSLSPLDQPLVLSHSVSLTGLSPLTTYHYRVVTADAPGNTGVSVDATFTTAAAPDMVPPSLDLLNPTDGGSVDGTISLTAQAADASSGIDRVEFRVNGRLIGTDTTAPYEVPWGSPKAYSRGPVVSFTFDDGIISQYNDYYPVLAAQGWPATVYPNIEEITRGWTSRFTVGQLAELRDRGWEISSHTYDHWSRLPANPTQADYEVSLAQAKSWLDANGFPNSGFASPDARIDATITAAVRKYHPYNRPRFGLQPLPLADQYTDIQYLGVGMGLDGAGDLAGLRTLLDRTVNENSWLIFLSHGWDPSSRFFTTVVDEVKARNLPVATVRDVIGGPYTVEVKAFDGYGNSTVESATVTASGTVIPPKDTTPPAVAITSPATGGIVSGQASLAASATDTQTKVWRTEFFIDGNLVGTDLSAPYSIQWDSTAYSETTHTLRVVAYDGTGNSASDERTFTVNQDPVPPVVHFTAPNEGGKVSGTMQIAANATDDDSGVERVEFRVNGTLVGTDRSAPYGATWDVPVPGTSGPMVSFTFDDNDRRQYTQLFPRLQAEGWPATSFVITDWTDMGTGMSVGELRDLRDHGWEISSHTSDHWLNLPANPTAADYEGPVAEAKAWLDARGFPNSGFASPRGIIDSNALSVVQRYNTYYRELGFRQNPLPVTDPFPLATTFEAEGPGDLPAARSVLDQAVAQKSWVILLTHGTIDDFSWFSSMMNEVKFRNMRVATIRDVLGGPYTIEAKAYDAVGNSTVSTVTVTADGTVPPSVDTTPPQVNLTAPAAGSTVGGTVAVSADATDTGSGVARVEFYIDTTLVAVDSAAPYSTQWNTALYVEGQHTVRAVAYDGRGNSFTDQRSVTVNQDPVAPAVDLLTPSDGGQASGAVQITATAADARVRGGEGGVPRERPPRGHRLIGALRGFMDGADARLVRATRLVHVR